jgi:hypothetical protein
MKPFIASSVRSLAVAAFLALAAAAQDVEALTLEAQNWKPPTN